MKILTERLRKPLDRAAQMPEADQGVVAAALERLVGAFTTGTETSVAAERAPALRPSLPQLWSSPSANTPKRWSI
jgi:hypothetical protein